MMQRPVQHPSSQPRRSRRRSEAHDDTPHAPVGGQWPSNKNPLRILRAFFVSVVVAPFLLSSSALAVGTNNFEFLRVGIAAGPVAMGGAYVALADGIGGMSWNPAGLCHITDSQAIAGYTRYPEGVQGGMIALGRAAASGWSAGLGVRYLSFGSMKLTTLDDRVGSSDFSASDIAVTISVAYDLTPGMKLGVGGTYISGSIESYSASAVGVDVGLIADTPVEGLYLGAAVRNLQVSGSSFYEDDVSLPTEARVGIGLRSSGLARLGLDVGFTRGEEVSFAAGAEVFLAKGMCLRAGMDQERWDMGKDATGWGTLSGFSWGVGFSWDEWRLDYGIHPFGRLGTTHRLSVRSEI